MSLIHYVRRKDGPYFKRFAIDWETTTIEWTDTRTDAEFFKTREGAEQLAMPLGFMFNLEIEEIDVEAGQEALQILATLEHTRHLDDYSYDIREREGLGWDGPKITAWGAACARAEQLIKPLLSRMLLAEANNEARQGLSDS